MGTREKHKGEWPYLEIFGAVVAQALDEYAHLMSKEKKVKGDIVNLEETRSYLFSPRQLEYQLKVMGISNILEIDYIRRKAGEFVDQKMQEKKESNES